MLVNALTALSCRPHSISHKEVGETSVTKPNSKRVYVRVWSEAYICVCTPRIHIALRNYVP